MITPINERILVEPLDESKTASWIILAQTNDRPEKWTVVKSDYKSLPEWTQIIFKKFQDTEIKQNWKKYLIIDIEDVLAKIEDV